MTVYVDDVRVPARVGRIEARWSHLTADSDAELHEFAARLGLRRSWFQDHPQPWLRHYDVTDNKRRQAIRLGAVAESWRDTARRIEAARHAADAPPPEQTDAYRRGGAHAEAAAASRPPDDGTCPVSVDRGPYADRDHFKLCRRCGWARSSQRCACQGDGRPVVPLHGQGDTP